MNLEMLKQQTRWEEMDLYIKIHLIKSFKTHSRGQTERSLSLDMGKMPINSQNGKITNSNMSGEKQWMQPKTGKTKKVKLFRHLFSLICVLGTKKDLGSPLGLSSAGRIGQITSPENLLTLFKISSVMKDCCTIFKQCSNTSIVKHKNYWTYKRKTFIKITSLLL